VHQAICASVAAGVTYVVAAGNSSSDAATSTPAAYDEVITVSAFADFDGVAGGAGSGGCGFTEYDDTMAFFSNFGSDVDISAPGVCIGSTVRGGLYDIISGTSQAAPHVSGTAALYVANHPAASPAAVRSALLAGAEAGPIAEDPDAFHEGVVKASGL
jgi:subtilisin